MQTIVRSVGVALCCAFLPCAVAQAVDPDVGIWVNPAEIAQLPVTGDAWDQIFSEASVPCGTPDLFDQSDDVQQCVLAKAIVSTRLFADDPDHAMARSMRDEVLVELALMMDEGNWCPEFQCTGGCGEQENQCPRRTLALGRNLGPYLAAAELIGIGPTDSPSRGDLITFLEGSGDPNDPPEFEQGILNFAWSGGTLADTHAERANNWGGHACASLAAAAILRGADVELREVFDIEVGWLGDCGNGDCSRFAFEAEATDWTCDGQPPTYAINELFNCMVNVSQSGGTDLMDLSGVQVDDMRRAGPFPAGCDAFPRACNPDVHIWEGLQGRIACAHILRRQGYDLWNESDQALLRSIQFQHQPIWLIDGIPGQPHPPHLRGDGTPNDDAFLAYIYNHAYGASLPLDPNPGQRDHGKSFGWTRYTLGEHPCGDLSGDKDFDGVCAPVDCNDFTPLCGANCTDADLDGLCLEADCDDDAPYCTTDCADGDGDGFCVTTDCDDGDSVCSIDCTDADFDGRCVDDDNCPGVSNAVQGTPQKVSAPMIASGDVLDYRVSPDGSTVIYLADQDDEGTDELYAAPLTGAVPVKLNGPLVAEGDVRAFAVTPDSGHVIYLADQQTDEVVELYAVPITGGVPLKLNDVLDTGGNVIDFAVSADSVRVVYLADQDNDEEFEIYAVRVSGGTRTQLNAELASGGDVFEFAISSNSASVVYRADQDSGGLDELYSVSIVGGAVTQLNDTLTGGGDVAEFAVSADSSTVVYRADQDTDSMRELYGVPIGGGTVTKLNGPLPGSGDVQEFRIAPDSSRVVYTADEDTNDVREIYSTPLTGGGSTKLNGSMISAGDVFEFAISPDSARVVYLADQDSSAVDELYSVPLVGGESVKLNGPLVASGDVRNFIISPNGSIVAYMADQDVVNDLEIYRVPIMGGSSLRLNGALVAGGDVVSYVFNPDGTRVVYHADQDELNQREIYRVTAAGGTPAKMNAPLISNGDVESYLVGSAEALVYLADQETTSMLELYVSPLHVDADGIDRDGDGFGAGCDCDDGKPNCTTDCTDDDGDGYCVTSDCDDSLPLCATDCTDDDADGYCLPDDCDDGKPNCATDCTDLDADGYCLPSDCDDVKPGCTTSCSDPDSDGYCDAMDCDESEPATYVRAPETNDGLDNQCLGDPGYGVIDETSGSSGFFNPANRDEFSWPAQPQATLYEAVRADDLAFASGCVVLQTADTQWDDPDLPPPDGLFHYLVRPAAPNVGSWGQGAGGAERLGVCPGG